MFFIERNVGLNLTRQIHSQKKTGRWLIYKWLKWRRVDDSCSWQDDSNRDLTFRWRLVSIREHECTHYDLPLFSCVSYAKQVRRLASRLINCNKRPMIYIYRTLEHRSHTPSSPPSLLFRCTCISSSLFRKSIKTIYTYNGGGSCAFDNREDAIIAENI